MNDNDVEQIAIALFVVAAGVLTAVPIALPAACLWSLVLPGDFDQMPAVIAGFVTWFVLYTTAFIYLNWRMGR